MSPRGTVLHVSFGDASKHPIIQNYLRAPSAVHHEVLQYRAHRAKPRRLVSLLIAMLSRRLSGHAGLVQAHDFVTAAVAAVMWRRRAIFDSHEIYSCLARGRFSAWIVDRLERFAATHCGSVVYPSVQRRDYYDSLDRRRSVIVENLYLPRTGPLSADEVCELERVTPLITRDGGLRYLYAGTMTDVRAIREIVAAFARPELAAHRLYLAGRPTELLTAALNTAGQNVSYLGEIQHSVMTRLLESFDAGFAIYKPRDANNMLAAPTKLFEYSYHGLTVISNRSPYIEASVQRFQLPSVIFTHEISPVGISAACQNVRRRADIRTPAALARLEWSRQQAVIDAMYRELNCHGRRHDGEGRTP